MRSTVAGVSIDFRCCRGAFERARKALATRYDKRVRHYQAMVTIACLKLWLPDLTDTP